MHTLQELESRLDLLESIRNYLDAQKILGTFLPALKQYSVPKEVSGEGSSHWFLHGNLNMGGTKSGRMSSDSPNLHNMPSTGSPYAKMIKECFEPPPGWIFVGADFNALEDVISALQTKDPNKLKVYTDGYDSHSLRAYAYFQEELPDIEDTVESINSIQTKYKHIRQRSKPVTFALTFMGTYRTLMANCGMSEAAAKKAEKNYHTLYKQSDEWAQAKAAKAAELGYMELAFGLKLRTHILKQCVIGSESTLPKEAHQEVKTAINALTQSYGLLTTRATNAFMEKVWNSPYRTKILPICQIHDATYFMVENSLGALEFTNTHLIEEMRWNDLDEIRDDRLAPSAALEVYAPNWANGIKLPNEATASQIKHILQEALCKKPAQ